MIAADRCQGAGCQALVTFDIHSHFSAHTLTRTVSTPQLTPARDDVPERSEIVDSASVLAESMALENYFQNGLRQERSSEDSDSDEELNEEDLDEHEDVVDNARTHSALAWADKFILETRRKGGRQTENSVLKLWKVSAKIPQDH